MKKQNYRPDTCGCTFEVNIDEQTGAMSVSKVFATCNAHASEMIEVTFSAAISDNRYKNKCVAVIESDYSVPALEVQWSFDEHRTLSLSHPNLTQEQIQTSIDKVPE